MMMERTRSTYYRHVHIMVERTVGQVWPNSVALNTHMHNIGFNNSQSTQHRDDSIDGRANFSIKKNCPFQYAHVFEQN